MISSITVMRSLLRQSNLLTALFVLTCVTSSIVWSWSAGKDMNWDSFNYHYYVAHLWSSERLSNDFLGASIQSYLNPISYLPFFWLNEAGLHSFTISAVLAAVHSLNLVFAAWMTALMIPATTPLRQLWILMAVVLAALAPVYGYEVGSTFNDISTAVFVFGGYIAALYAGKELKNSSRLSLWCLAGMLLGVASGLKLTNAIFAIAVLPGVLMVPARLRSSFALILGGVAGFLIINGHWAWRLWIEFGNPFFPFFNGIFQSPDFPAFSIKIYRFIPESLQAALMFPLDALRPSANVYMERPAPDLRYLALFVLLLGAVSYFLLRRKTRAGVAGEPAKCDWIVPSWLIAYALWLLSSGNGRYFAPGALMLGPVLAWLTVRTLGANRFSVYFLSLLVVLQFVQGKETSEERWSKVPWTERWFEVTVPASLVEKPYLYLLPATQTSSFLIPRLHPNSSFTNISGQVALHLERPGGKRIQRLMELHGSNIRSLYALGAVTGSGHPLPNAYTDYDGVFQRFGLRTDPAQCELIRAGETGGRVVIKFDDGDSVVDPEGALLLSCLLVPDEVGIPLEEQRAVDAVLDKIEHACRYFDPKGTLTEKTATGWIRRYVNTDMVVAVTADKEVRYWFFGTPDVRSAGTLADWQNGKLPPISCSLKRFGIRPVENATDGVSVRTGA